MEYIETGELLVELLEGGSLKGGRELEGGVAAGGECRGWE